MALLQLNYLSKTIGAHNSLNVILPEDESFFDTNREAKPLKSMLVLHGLSSDANSYIRYTSIERYAMIINLQLSCLMQIIVSILI